MTDHLSIDITASVDGRYGGLQQRMAQLGMAVSIWDADGECLIQRTPQGGLCPFLDEPSCSCAKQEKQFADRVGEQGKPLIGRSPTGCVWLGVPLHERRRLAGVAVGCYCPTDLLDEETLHRLSDRLGLDFQAARDLATTSCRHSVADAKDLLSVLAHSVEVEAGLRMATADLDELSQNLTMTYEELSLVYQVSGKMKLTEKPERFLEEEVCQGLLEVLDVGGVAAVTYAPPLDEGSGQVITAGQWPLTEGDTCELVNRLQPEMSDNSWGLVKNEMELWAPDLAQHGVARLVAVAMPGENGAMGLLLVVNKQDAEFDSVDMKLIRAVANQAGVFITNHRFYADLQDLLLGVLDALTASIDAKDPYTCGHSRRVASLSKRLAEASGMRPERAERIYLAGLLHDIGKIGVPEGILRKPGQLSDQEFTVIKRHPETSAKILSGIRQLEDVIVAIRHHHERMDGRGYPDGLKGDAFPFEARVIGLADCFDAMTSNRVYRKAKPLETVTDEIRKNAGTQFDAGLVEKLLSMDLEAYLVEQRESIEANTMGMPDLEVTT